ncbi:hypothetical protein Rs2_29777 [Raphanus sativus]|uniref:Small ribosomal subunit protein uS15c n=1 Tax=Raphanus sativus TaxID=3726 RepID=A0A6J0K2H8_RAPSA|nr:uncharacterized protein LOC108813220 [Raphanus sativus]KAJ4890029.1 hypothetical protein Rs2_29777 [Raphanus sativus]
MALLLARRKLRLPSAPSLIRLFSNSSSNPPPKVPNASVEKPPQSPSNSPFTDVKNSLRQNSTQSPNHGSSRFSDNQSRGSLQDLSIKLAKFKLRSAAPPPKGAPNSFEALYKQKVAANSSDHRKGREMDDEGRSREGETEEFLKIYREDELGEKLKMLRPEGKKEEGWFSLEELNQRLVKLRQVDEKDVKNQRVNFSVLRNVIGTFEDEEAKNEAVSLQNLDILGYLDGTPEYKHYPPKDELVETYFHSDNLSSAEKMKIELTKVREDFKMSESDCGSARVQVAQLTTKIKHLSSALHEKDKHSKKGLFAMVLKRKKLLKYLRRTDWDSYCHVLSNLGLRDNLPDYKIPDYKDET